MEDVIYSCNYFLNNKLACTFLCSCTFSKSHVIMGDKQLSAVGHHRVFKATLKGIMHASV